MNPWDGWPFARAYLLMLTVAFVVIGAQVFLLHWRAAFRSSAMWGPVVLAPIIAAGGAAAAVARNDLIGWAAVAIFGLGFVDGMIGLFLHLRGIARRVGGFTARNLTAGPPPLLPVAFAALAVTGGFAVVWEAW